MLQVAIVEDVHPQALELKDLLAAWAKTHTPIDIFIFNQGADFLNALQRSEDFDVVFMDIELGDDDGMALSKTIRELGYDGEIIFTTNYSEHAIKGYAVSAFRYYVKPIQARDVKECMNYVLNKIAGEAFQYKYHGETTRIPWKNIIFIESQGHYIDVFTVQSETPIHIKMALKTVMRQSPNYIRRCQRSFIVNVNHIKKRMGNKVMMLNDRILDIAPSKSQDVRDALDSIAFPGKGLRK